MAMYRYEGLIGQYSIEEKNEHIVRICFEHDAFATTEIEETPLIKEAQSQLAAYFAGKLRSFSLPFAPEGTDYMKKIWNLLCQIPYGKTASYSEIAAQAGNVKAARAVGLANHNNPIPILIPCHRVVGKSGKLVGYRGGLNTKELLLDLEQQYNKTE